MSVLLPEPEGPMMATYSFSRSSRSTPSSAWMRSTPTLYTRVTPSSLMTILSDGVRIVHIASYLTGWLGIRFSVGVCLGLCLGLRLGLLLAFVLDDLIVPELLQFLVGAHDDLLAFFHAGFEDRVGQVARADLDGRDDCFAIHVP